MTASRPPAQAPAARSQASLDSKTADRIAAAADAWKRKLLDLTKRNRALNFRVNKVSTVTVVDEHPAEAFRQLYLREQAMKFKAAPEPEASAPPPSSEASATPGNGRAPIGAREEPTAAESASESSWMESESDDEDSSLAPDFAPYDPGALGEHHTDEWLQTTATPEALDKSLRRLDELARTSIEEQGVNPLFLALGMLHYRESRDSTVTLRAPLVMLPVELSRKSARSGYTVREAEDEPLVNPALAEYLRRDHAIVLPELPESGVIEDDYDLQKFLAAVSDLISGKEGWSVKTDIYLALFNFQKFVMYKDLEVNVATLREHRLVRQLVTRRGDDAMTVVGLPDEIRQMELDRDYPPEATHQVVDADSSQLRAIAASAHQHDLVIEGPPGTGKSQTITNLIAQALSAGKSVLFVAEKMAALSVVHERLLRARLGEFCLELHSTKANKRTVMRELGAALDASLQSVAAPTISTQRLPQVRATLSEYVHAVHAPYGTLGVSPFRAYGELGRVMGAPRVRYDRPVAGITREQLDQTLRDLGDLTAAAAEIGTPSEHPWRDSARTFLTEDDLETVRELAAELVAGLNDLMARAAGVREAFSLPPIETFADVDTAASIAQLLARSPGAPLGVLENEAWNSPPAEATEFIQKGRALVALRERVARSFSPDVLEQEHAGDIAYVERKSQGVLGFLALLDGRYRAIRKRWTGYRLATYRPSLMEQAAEMKQVDCLLAERRELAQAEPEGRELFGALWEGERSSWDILDDYVRWVVEFRGACVRHGLSGRALEVAAKPAPDVSAVNALRESAVGAKETLSRLVVAMKWPSNHLADSALSDIMLRATALAEHAGLGPKWAAFESARQTAARSLALELLPLVMTGELPFDQIASAFLRAFYLKWLSAVVKERPALERFHTITHEERLREFRELDERVLLENRAALVGMLRDRLQHELRQPEAAAQMPFLRRELARQRGLSPLRRTMKEAGTAVRAIKPCFLMSPLTVAQLLDGSAPAFDLIIFDEASQLPPEDSVGAIMRGRQLVVVGDPKQLPPTNFFSVSTGTTNVVTDEDGQPLVEDAESILEEFMGAGIPMCRLKWHYRSAHESLISFSNVQFYESDLYTFPSVETGNATYGLQFEHLPDGVYEGKGLNMVEARRVADEVVRFAREQLECRASGEPAQSLGVGTFNLRQQLAILDELEQRRRDDPTIEPFFDRGAVEPFFVKNLENIQGDERDVIFISVTYGRAPDGRVRYNFGPLNGENGWRRLNVLTTRARQRMRVFSSMRGEDISAAGTTSRGAHLLREFLIYAERGRLDSVSASLAADAESPFERDVLSELTNRGITVVPQVGVAGYRIDLGVLDDVLPGRFLCGIECDGAGYHSSETARDRDRLRQQVLEARGWVIHRLWSTDWFKDRQGQVERILGLIEQTRQQARVDREAALEVRARQKEEAARREIEAAEAARRDAEELARTGAASPYRRPTASPYTFAPGAGHFARYDILAAPRSQLLKAVVSVVDAEGPIHETDLYMRVAGMWDTRAGSRIQACIREACNAAQRAGEVRKRGQFFWNASGGCAVRSRTGTRISAERIAPEEYELAVRAVLQSGHGFSRAQLMTEVRALFGFSRTGAALEEAIGSAIESMLASGALGEASTGIRLRRGERP